MKDQLLSDAIDIIKRLELSAHSGDGSRMCPICCYTVDFDTGKARHAGDCPIRNILNLAKRLKI